MNILPHLRAAGAALSAIEKANTPGEIVACLDEVIRQCGIMSTQIGDNFPHEVGALRSEQLARVTK